MAEITKDELKKEITAILKDADLTTMSAKKVRQQIEEKLDCDLSSRKKEVDDIVMQCLKGTGKKSSTGKKNGKGDDDDEGEDEEEEDEEEEEEDDDEEEEKPKRASKKPTPQKRKKDSSEESGSDAEEKEDSEEEYSPSKKAKGGKPKGKAGGKRKKKGSDSDSDEDWGKGKKSGGGGGGGGAKKGGAKRGGGGFTKVCNLSPELAAVVGADQMARHEVVKKIWSIIKEKKLYDPKNKQFAICNDELLKVFGVKRFRTFGMMKLLKNHFVD